MQINIQRDPESNAIYMEVTERIGISIFVYFAPHEFHEIRAYMKDLMPGANVYVDREDADEGDCTNRT